jgi:hypothetical protein
MMLPNNNRTSSSFGSKGARDRITLAHHPPESHRSSHQSTRVNNRRDTVVIAPSVTPQVTLTPDVSSNDVASSGPVETNGEVSAVKLNGSDESDDPRFKRVEYREICNNRGFCVLKIVPLSYELGVTLVSQADDSTPSHLSDTPVKTPPDPTPTSSKYKPMTNCGPRCRELQAKAEDSRNLKPPHPSPTPVNLHTNSSNLPKSLYTSKSSSTSLAPKPKPHVSSLISKQSHRPALKLKSRASETPDNSMKESPTPNLDSRVMREADRMARLQKMIDSLEPNQTT